MVAFDGVSLHSSVHYTLVCSLGVCTPLCNDGVVAAAARRDQAVEETRNRILDVAREVLGHSPDASMGDIAVAAGVVRRTVYGHFPNRSDLVRTLAQRAVSEMVEVLTPVDRPEHAADLAWVEFVTEVWPLVHRYRVLLALRRGEHGEEIHAVLAPVDEILARLVQRGQDSEIFARHLPADLLSQLAYSTVFAIADYHRSSGALDAEAAALSSLLLLGVPAERARSLLQPQS